MQTKFKSKLYKSKYGNIHDLSATIKFSEGDLMELLRICNRDNSGWSKGLAKEIQTAINQVGEQKNK